MILFSFRVFLYRLWFCIPSLFLFKKKFYIDFCFLFFVCVLKCVGVPDYLRCLDKSTTKSIASLIANFFFLFSFFPLLSLLSSSPSSHKRLSVYMSNLQVEINLRIHHPNKNNNIEWRKWIKWRKTWKEEEIICETYPQRNACDCVLLVIASLD